jgi:hypothetical protein
MPYGPTPPVPPGLRTVTHLLDDETFALVRRLAELHARIHGGRVSASAALRQLIRDEAGRRGWRAPEPAPETDGPDAA